MNLEKSKKRIAKKVKMGFQGFPEITILYLGSNEALADEVVLTLILEEGADSMEERFKSKADVREDEVIQSAIVKMIERSEAKTVKSCSDVQLKNQ